jgi:hypothetical protein
MLALAVLKKCVEGVKVQQLSTEQNISFVWY